MSLLDFFRRRPDPATTPASAPDTLPAESATTGGPARPVERRRRPRTQVPEGTAIMIVDDSKTVVAVLRKMLRENNFTTLEAYDAESALEILRKEIAGWPKVAHVQLDSAWVKRFDAFLRLARLALWMLAGIFAAGLVAVTFNTIRLQVMAQAAEIEVARMIGATDAFIRRPFYWFGGLQGALGGLVALGTMALGIEALAAPVARLAETYGAVFALSGPEPEASLAIVAFAAFLGWLGAAISVRRHLAGT